MRTAHPPFGPLAAAVLLCTAFAGCTIVAPHTREQRNTQADSGIRDLRSTVIGGRYKILGVLGEGGFGIVYEAEQQRPMRRRVALKVWKAWGSTG